MIILITGGARSGKSSYAQRLALSLSDQPIYIATARRWDTEFEKRIHRHQQERDERWTTLEEQRTVASLEIDNRVSVIDCITLWLTNFFMDAKQDIDAALSMFKEQIQELQKKKGTFILITNEIGMGLHADSVTGRQFTDLQGWANQYAATQADQVFLMVSGIPVLIKGR
jgi:adenosylcobinamide kinase/adenosylcobinamide-phosphate guanylyltransferase